MFYHGLPVLAPWGWASSIISVLISVILISVIVRIILRIVRGEHTRCHRRHFEFCGQNGNPSTSARDILDERYAKGEIDEEEYRRKKENLK